LTLIQDAGRHGTQKYGVPVGGALDKMAHQTANWLVGNPLNTPVLEITMMGPKIEIEGDCQIAITGANISPMINNLSVPRNETLDVNNQSIISFGKLVQGCRAYLAIGGQWKINKWLGSGSAAIFSGKELVPGGMLQKNQQIGIETHPFISKKTVADFENNYPLGEAIIRVLPGPEFHHFPREMIGQFFSTPFKISSDSNRMGYRLEQKLHLYQPKGEMISSGTIPGTIQITSSGQPIILLADAQTIGGYPRIANVISADMDNLAQLKPADQIRFQLVTLEDAYTALGEKNKLTQFLNA
jgi:antagonist of KipI